MQAILRNADALAAAAASGGGCCGRIAAWFTRFKDKVVLVGAVDPLLKDISPTPSIGSQRQRLASMPISTEQLKTGLYFRVKMPVTVGIISLLTLSVSMLSLGSGVPRMLSIMLLIDMARLPL